MAYSVDSVAFARFKYSREEVDRFERAKRYLQQKSQARRLITTFLSGIRVPEDLAPRRAYLRRASRRRSSDSSARQSRVDEWCEATGKDPYEYGNPIHDMTNTHFGWVLSIKAKRLIESLEDNCHQFFEFEFLKPDGSPIDRPFWLLNICKRFDAIAVDRSSIVKAGPDLRNDPDNWRYMSSFWFNRGAVNGKYDTVRVGRAPSLPPKFFFRRESVQGHALWAGIRWPGVFVSDALHELIKEANLQEVRFFRHYREI